MIIKKRQAFGARRFLLLPIARHLTLFFRFKVSRDIIIKLEGIYFHDFIHPGR